MSSLFERIKRAIPSGGLEIAPYKIVRTNQEYEERIYPPQTWVRTQTKRHTSREDCNYAMFAKLFDYISGENDQQVTVAMTAPVVVQVEPDSDAETDAASSAGQTGGSSIYTMAFYIPSPFDQKPPLPNDCTVSIEYRPELRIFARTYGGFTNDRIDQEERCRLLNSLSQEDRQLIHEDVFYCASYDPPLKLFFRRNEIWLPIIQSTN